MRPAQLNHILIPSTKEGRDRLRRTRLARLLRPAEWLYYALTIEGRFLAVFWLLAGAAALDLRASRIYVLWSVLTGFLLASLLLRRRHRLDGVSVRVDAPARATVGEPAVLNITLTNPTGRDHRGIRIEGPLLPWDGSYVGEERPGVDLLPALGQVSVRTPIRFSSRGQHHLDRFSAAEVVPFALAQGRPVYTEGVRLVVVPQIARVSRLTLPLVTRYQPGGVSVASRTGEALDFVGVRRYRAGDRVRDIHHRTWARVGYPVVRELAQEYFARAGVVVDTDREVAGDAAYEAAISLAAGVVARLSQGEALIDLLVAGDRVHRLTLGRSLGHLEQALDLLACVEPGPAPDPGQLEPMLAPHLPRLSSVVFVVLAWDEPRQALADTLRRAGTPVLVLLVADREVRAENLVTVAPEQIRTGAELFL